MTPAEYKQLRAYSWYDGIYLAVLWIASFACIIASGVHSVFSTLSLLLTIATPFFVGYRLKVFREEGRQGRISFSRALLYCFRVFFNAAILFALAQWAYMQYLDNGHLTGTIQTMMNQTEYQDMMAQLGFDTKELLSALKSITPVQLAMSYFIQNTLAGLALSVLIALVMKR